MGIGKWREGNGEKERIGIRSAVVIFLRAYI